MATSSFPELGDQPEEIGAAAAYRLDDEQFARAIAYGTAQQVAAGDFVFTAGDEDGDLILVADGLLEVVRTATADAPEEHFLRSGPGQFRGELNLLTGQTRLLSARVAEAGTVHRVGPAAFRLLMAQDTSTRPASSGPTCS